MSPVVSLPFADQAGASAARLPGGNLGGEVRVTPHLSPISRTKLRQEPVISAGNASVFCDWLSIYQNHGSGLPNVNAGAVLKYDADGSLECLTLKKARIDGSHDTSVYIRCDGHTVWFEGNVSRFGRRDNVFGFDFETCMGRINELLVSLGLPAFTAGRPAHRQMPNGQWQKVYTGARITRMDVTQNFSAGSPGAASAFMTWLSSQQASRVKTGTYGEGETVDFGRGSRQVYTKAYLKAPELRRHAKKRRVDDEGLGSSVEVDEYVLELAEWCHSVGLVRWETTYKSTWLIDHNQQFLGGIDMNVIYADFEKRKEVFTRANVSQDQMTDLPARLLSVYRMWSAGDDIALKYKRSQFYNLRKQLLPFGVDIAVRCNVKALPIRTRVLTLAHVEPPSFYQRSSTSALAA